MLKTKLLIAIIFILSSTANSTPVVYHSVKLAIFDNPQPDPSSKDTAKQFINSYLAGINTAITVAASKGIYITKKEFFHANNLASIIEQAANTKTWNPDVIVGLSTSNDFLMSKAFFDNQVVLSISATDPTLLTLPKGFYSLGIPDSDAVNAIIKFIHQYYPNANLFITTAAESKESVDFADLLARKYKNQFMSSKVIERKFLTDDMNHMVISKFMFGYEKDDVIVVMSIGYDSAIDLMNKISNYIKPIRPVFITSTDNWGNNTAPLNMGNNYDSFRIDTLTGGEDTKNYKIFSKNFKTIYHMPPTDKISFVTYQAVMSFVEALLQYPIYTNNIKITRELILNSYLSALKHNPNWCRPPYYVVYKLKNQKEIFFEKIT